MGSECEARELLVCFVDIKKWLRGTSTKSAQETFRCLTEIYEKVLPIAEEHGGQLLKVIGDAALIVWEPGDTKRAIEAARIMRAEFAKLQEKFQPAEPMQMSVAMALGPVIAGEMGPPSIRRFDVIGEPVNTAAVMLRGHDFAITQQVAAAAEGAELTGIEIVMESGRMPDPRG